MKDKLFEEVIDNYDALKYSLLKAQTFDESHFGFPEIYYKIMETDKQRVDAFHKAFQLNNNFKDAIVCEIGVGTLPLTKLYMPFVKKAYLIENNPDLIPFINKEIAKYPWADKVEVIYADALTVDLPEKVDFVVGELMSIYCANEFQVQIFQHMRDFLKPGGKLFPNRIVNFARLCEAEIDSDVHHYPVNFTRHQPMFLTQQFLVNEIELLKEKKQGVKLSFSVPVLFSGTINALYLESYVEVTEGSNFTGTDSLMPPTVLKTTNTQEVKAGDLVHIDFSFDYGSSLDDISCVLS
ncbi:methyltransferase domain-containing protein [Aquimarina sp. MMG015]|uniref:methyltransferase domain-containing protein n=1 Tax=Aquimarina TaxID=290174 RepID=UPI0004234860|nr:MULTISPECIES: methyltransferase domain-containing protein [Aquimarina]AXT56639.1 methyltransferase domain-containing protein [Aquimarina sp. AD1]MBQ4802650.1 methyltransferase domain-containing protein [Aquimarina sp. MMG015]RKN00817.1 methyltransferase domain-containing protein [Aquimarina sp. AD1]